MSKTLFPTIHKFSQSSASAFLPFERYTFKPKIINWRLPDQTTDSEFDFMDGSNFDFMDGSDFDFVGG